MEVKLKVKFLNRSKNVQIKDGKTETEENYMINHNRYLCNSNETTCINK